MTKSKYRGVKPSKLGWKAVWYYYGKQQLLGVYATEEEAALAYNRRAVREFGERAKVNDVENKVCIS